MGAQVVISNMSRLADQVQALNCAVMGSNPRVGPVHYQEVRSDLHFWSFWRFFPFDSLGCVPENPGTELSGVRFSVGTILSGTTVLNTVGCALTAFLRNTYNGHSFFERLASCHFLLFSNHFNIISYVKTVEFSLPPTWFIRSNLHPSLLFSLCSWAFPVFVWWEELSCFTKLVRLVVSRDKTMFQLLYRLFRTIHSKCVTL